MSTEQRSYSAKEDIYPWINLEERGVHTDSREMSVVSVKVPAKIRFEMITEKSWRAPLRDPNRVSLEHHPAWPVYLIR